MIPGERVREIRKYLNLTLEKFGEKLGVGKGAISAIETGTRNLTGQMSKSICREFNVNEEWLQTGSGEMFLEIPEEDEYFKAATMLSKENDTEAMNAIIQYWKLDSASKKAIWNFIYNLSKKK